MQYNRVNDIYGEVAMEIKPDDYYNNGTVEKACFGRHTLLKNIMSYEQHNKMMKKLNIKYLVLKKRIDRLVKTLILPFLSTHFVNSTPYLIIR